MYRKNKSNNIYLVYMILFILFGIGMMVELVSLKYLMTSQLNDNNHMFFIVHILGSVLISLSLPFLLKPTHRCYKANTFLFSLAIQTFIPTLGAFMIVIVYMPRKNATITQYTVKNGVSKLNRRKNTDTLPTNITKNINNIVLNNSISSILTSKNVTPDERQKAVLNTIKLQDKEAVSLLRKALIDEDDDVRLIAYALLKRKENTIIKRLQLRLEKVKETHMESPVYLHKAIAKDCWEMVYIELAQGEVKKHLLEVAIKHIKIVLQKNNNDPGLNLLYGKILLRKGELKEARIYFNKAQNSGVDINKILPYLAEIAFQEKRLGRMSAYLKNLREDVFSYKVSRMLEVVNGG